MHETIITEEEYDKIQVLLGRQGRPRAKTQIFDFTGMMRCAECGAAITAENKSKRLKNGTVNLYVYYHCTKRINPNCTQGSIEITELNKQIVKEIDKLEIPPEFRTFAMNWWKKENEKEVESRNSIVNAQQKAYKTCIAKLDGFSDMRASGEIDAEEFATKRAPLLVEKKRLESLFASTANRIDAWINTGDQMFTFIEDAKTKFKTGTIHERRAILAALGSNFLIRDKKLSIDIEKCLFPIGKISPEVLAIKERLEPINTVEKQQQFEQMCASNPGVLSVLCQNLWQPFKYPRARWIKSLLISRRYRTIILEELTHLFKDMSKLFHWIVDSSANPDNVSLTIRGILLQYVSIIILGATVFGYHLADSSVVNVITDISSFVGAFLTCIGLVRKIYYAIYPKKV